MTFLTCVDPKMWEKNAKIWDEREMGIDVEKEKMEGVSKCTFWLHPRRCVRMAKMQGTENEGAESVLKYMTEPEYNSNEADWLL